VTGRHWGPNDRKEKKILKRLVKLDAEFFSVAPFGFWSVILHLFVYYNWKYAKNILFDALICDVLVISFA
jgi:hypothetical protein